MNESSRWRNDDWGNVQLPFYPIHVQARRQGFGTWGHHYCLRRHNLSSYLPILFLSLPLLPLPTNEKLQIVITTLLPVTFRSEISAQTINKTLENRRHHVKVPCLLEMNGECKYVGRHSAHRVSNVAGAQRSFGGARAYYQNCYVLEDCVTQCSHFTVNSTLI